jgi:hypothetical protein
MDGNDLEVLPMARSYKGDVWRKSLSSTYLAASGKRQPSGSRRNDTRK